MGGDGWQQGLGQTPQQDLPAPPLSHGKGKGKGCPQEGLFMQDSGEGMSRVIIGKLVYGQNAVPPGHGPTQMAGRLNAQGRRLMERAQVLALCCNTSVLCLVMLPIKTRVCLNMFDV